MSSQDFLTPILARKQLEIVRRSRPSRVPPRASGALEDLVPGVRRALTRAMPALPRVIAEIKLRSPSAGEIRPRRAGEVARIARSYDTAGAAAVSVLCDGLAFGGTPLDVRRAARATAVPLLFKEFVLDEVQLAVARAMGAHMVLLLVRALERDALHRLVDATLALGMAPVVEAANPRELEAALATEAPVVGVNARDLGTFRVDTEAALSALAAVPTGRIAVHMSGIRSSDDLARAAASRADAVLIGEGLMRAPDPGARLKELLASATAT